MAKKWIQKAIKHPGALHKALKVPAGQKIPAGKLAKAAKSSNPKLAKQANLAKTLGKMRTKKYAEGGDIDVGDVQMPNIDDAMSFNTAYKMARNSGAPIFSWRGKRYSSDPTGDMGETTVTAKRPTQRMDIPTPPSKGVGGRDYSDPFSMRPNVDPEEYDQQARMEGTLGRMGTVASLTPIGAGERAAGEGAGFIGKEGMTALKALKKRGQLARNVTAGKQRKALVDQALRDADRAESQRRAKAVWKAVSKEAAANGEWTHEYGLGLKKGGKVNRFAKGGSIRGNGCESKGKTKGRFI